MKKIICIIKEMTYLIKEHKLYFIAPILFILALLALLVFQLGPAIITTFIYAGV